MSYMRIGHPLKYFKGESKAYVYPSAEGYVEDYNSDYKDNATFCELIEEFVYRATGDKKYSLRIMKILAKKLDVEKDLI